MVVQNNIVIMELPTPKKVTLPKDRVFYAKYRRVKRTNLPPNIYIQKTRRWRTKKIKSVEVLNKKSEAW